MYSVVDVLQIFNKKKLQSTKFYFKTQILENPNPVNLNEIGSSIDGSKRFVCDGSESSEEPLKQSIKDQYYEFELKKIKKCHNRNVFVLQVKDVSNILKYQQKMIDSMYQDAIENNYSHEQMTPLNSILGNSQIILNKIYEFRELLCRMYQLIKVPIDKKEMARLDETYTMMRAIQQSGQIMWYYNQNQIQRMKIRKNEFLIRTFEITDPENIIEKVVYPFFPMILQKNVEVHFSRASEFKLAISTDWDKYELILFNIVQNAVKYN